MAVTLPSENSRAPEAPVMRKRYYYLDAQARRQIDEILRRFGNQRSSASLWTDLGRQLPLEKARPESLRQRVEGLNYAADCLWSLALQLGKNAFGTDFDRQKLQCTVRMLPISHYHYLMGSHEPRDLLLTRRDGLHDPDTALFKLQKDIEALLNFICQLPPAQLGNLEQVSIPNT